MGKIRSYLSYTQRLQIESGINAKLSIREIAQHVGVHISTIYKEIQRGSYEKRKTVYDCIGMPYYATVKTYSADIAQQRYEYAQTAKGCPLKIGHDIQLANYIEDRIVKGKLSPLAVIGEIKRKGLSFSTNICVSTLYSYIRNGVFLSLTMSNLPMQGSRHKSHVRRAKRPPAGVSIEQRPKEINKRLEFGHWEMDCVCGPTKNSLLVLTERMTRKEIIFVMPNQTSASVVHCLNRLEYKYGKLFRKVFKTITVDNGSEFSDANGLQRSIYRGQRTMVYYCHPYCSSERGTNERMNREIRRLIPKGTRLDKYTQSDINIVADWVNTYPRQVLDFATSQELFDEQLRLLG